MNKKYAYEPFYLYFIFESIIFKEKIWFSFYVNLVIKVYKTPDFLAFSSFFSLTFVEFCCIFLVISAKVIFVFYVYFLLIYDIFQESILC